MIDDERRKIRLRPATVQRLEAMASVMKLDVDTLAERLVLDALPALEHEDLIGAPVALQEEMS